LREPSDSDGQTLAAFGAARIDHGTAATGFHANEKTMSAGAANLGGLVSAFHFGNPKGLDVIIAKSKLTAMTLLSIPTSSGNRGLWQIFSTPATPYKAQEKYGRK